MLLIFSFSLLSHSNSIFRALILSLILLSKNVYFPLLVVVVVIFLFSFEESVNKKTSTHSWGSSQLLTRHKNNEFPPCHPSLSLFIYTSKVIGMREKALFTLYLMLFRCCREWKFSQRRKASLTESARWKFFSLLPTSHMWERDIDLFELMCKSFSLQPFQPISLEFICVWLEN